ncbi:DMT family transporter [Streptomyces polygonati]|uniref:DMT family transporter n=1 Tax=Streptomyces polygonati TaxID=1617087 RepID=A0ABV8HQA1_9ACTN
MTRGYLLIALSAAGFGLMPVIATYAYQDGLTVATLLFLRFAVAAAVFLPYAWWHIRRTGRPRSADLLRMLLLGGVLYAAQSALYFSSVKHISPALASLLLYLYPALVAGVSAVVGRERPSRGVIGSLVLSLAGVALALGHIGSSLSLTGVLEALGAAGVYMVYILFGDRVGGAVHPVVMTAFVSLSAAIAFLVYGPATGGLALGFEPRGWLPVLCIALASTVLAILCFFLGMALIGPTRASIASTLEPVVSIVATAVLLGGGLTWLQLLGAVLVLSGGTIGVLSRRGPRASRRAPRPSTVWGSAHVLPAADERVGHRVDHLRSWEEPPPPATGPRAP